MVTYTTYVANHGACPRGPSVAGYVSVALVSEPSGIALKWRRNSLTAAVLAPGGSWLEVSVQDQRIEIDAVGPHDGAMVD